MEAIQKELNTNVFILQVVQNSLIKEFLECFESVICKDTKRPPAVVNQSLAVRDVLILGQLQESHLAQSAIQKMIS